MPRMRVTDILCCTYNIVPVRDVVDLRSGVSQVAEVGHRRSSLGVFEMR